MDFSTRSPQILVHLKPVHPLVWLILNKHSLPRLTKCSTGTRPSEGRSSITEDDARQKSAFREDGAASQPSLPDGPSQSAESRNPIGAIGNDASSGKGVEPPAEASSSTAQEPLAGMSEADKWGIKGLLTLMAKYPSYHALVHGLNPAELGLDLSSDA